MTYTEKDLGGVLDTEAAYKDSYVRGLYEPYGWAIWPPIPFHMTQFIGNWTSRQLRPTAHIYLLGTQGWGSDVLARLLYGFRLSVLFGLSLTLVSTLIGVTVGALQGFFGGAVDLLVSA